MKRIIGLYGAANVGKTHSLRMLIEMIAHELGNEIEHQEISDKKFTFIVNGKTVCICPAGDNGYEIGKAIEYVNQNNFDVAIFGSRSKGEPANRLNAFVSECGFESVEWRQCPNTKYWPGDLRTEVEMATAKMLRRMID